MPGGTASNAVADDAGAGAEGVAGSDSSADELPDGEDVPRLLALGSAMSSARLEAAASVSSAVAPASPPLGSQGGATEQVPADEMDDGAAGNLSAEEDFEIESDHESQGNEASGSGAGGRRGEGGREHGDSACSAAGGVDYGSDGRECELFTRTGGKGKALVPSVLDASSRNSARQSARKSMAEAEAIADHRGFVQKMGGRSAFGGAHKWHSRFMVLSGGGMEYYLQPFEAHEQAPPPKSKWSVRLGTVKLHSPARSGLMGKRGALTFELEPAAGSGHKPLVFAAATPKELQTWRERSDGLERSRPTLCRAPRGSTIQAAGEPAAHVPRPAPFGAVRALRASRIVDLKLQERRGAPSGGADHVGLASGAKARAESGAGDGSGAALGLRARQPRTAFEDMQAAMCEEHGLLLEELQRVKATGGEGSAEYVACLALIEGLQPVMAKQGLELAASG